MKIKDPEYDYDLNLKNDELKNPERAQWIEKSKNLINELNDLVRKEQKHMLTQDKAFVIPNFFEEAEMLEWAGISFGETETFKLSKSIKRLAVMSGADRLRFVGKIYGSQKDYWLACGVLSQAEELCEDKNMEKRGEGVNKLVFWVTDNLLNDWI